MRRSDRDGRDRTPAVPPELLHQRVNLRAVQRLLLEEPLGELVQELKIRVQQFLGPEITGLDDAPDLGVDLDGRALGIIDLLGEIPSEKNLLLFFTEGHGSELF